MFEGFKRFEGFECLKGFVLLVNELVDCWFCLAGRNFSRLVLFAKVRWRYCGLRMIGQLFSTFCFVVSLNYL